MEHEFDRPAEVEELEQKKTDSVEEEKTTASEKKAESQRAAEIGYGWGPDRNYMFMKTIWSLILQEIY